MSFDNTQPPAPHDPVAVAAPAPQAPPTLPPAGPTSSKNTLGLVALILAVAGILIGLIPLLGVVGWPLLTAAFVISIIALAKKKKPVWMGVVALILSIVGPIVLGVVGMVTAATVVGAAIEESTGSSVEQPAAEDEGDEAPAEEPAAEVGTSRDNPAPIGSVITGPEWKVVINSVTLGATDAVLAANPVNSAPEAGFEYILINTTQTYTGADKGMPALNQINYVTPDGVTIDGLENFAVAPDALDSLSELYTDASATGNIVLAVPSATAAEGVLVVTPGILADDVFVAVK